jgi:hypothetical protein
MLTDSARYWSLDSPIKLSQSQLHSFVEKERHRDRENSQGRLYSNIIIYLPPVS